MAAADPAFSGPDLCALTARDAIAGLRDKSLHPDDLVSAALTRIAQTGPAINATVTLCEARARDRAQTATGLLAGLPITIKDLTPVEGVRTTWGTPGLADTIPEA